MLQGLYAEKSLASITLTPDIFHIPEIFCMKYFNKNNSSFLTLTIFLCLFLLSLKYGWRVSRIVAWQRFNGEFENNNNTKKKA